MVGGGHSRHIPSHQVSSRIYVSQQEVSEVMAVIMADRTIRYLLVADADIIVEARS